MDIQKEFEKFCVDCKDNKGCYENQFSVKPLCNRIWQACATLMSDRVKELDGDIKDIHVENEIKRERLYNADKQNQDLQAENEKLKKEMVTFVGYSKYIENQHLQSKLDEAVEIIKVAKESLDIDLQCTFSRNTWEELLRQIIAKAEKFLSSLDKPKEEL